MKYLSTFSGIGGFELGIQLAYETIRDSDVQTKRGGQTITEGELQEDGQGLHTVPSETTLYPKDGNNEYVDGSIDQRQPHCIGYSEIDKYAQQIYQKHFPTHHNYGDITRIVAEDLPDFDLLVGGFPCQAFSIAGKRGGFEDTRGTMFFELARILRAKQPRLCVFENVKGLLSHDGGKSFATIIQTLDELGYDCQWQVLNSKNHGVPQNRERVFIVGHLRGTPRPQVFPFTETTGTTDQRLNQGHPEVASTLRSRYGNGTGSHIQQLNQPTHSNDRVYGADGISPTLNTMQGGNRQPFVALPLQGIDDILNGNGSTQEKNALETLRVLQDKIGAQAFTEWGLRVFDSFQSQEVLREVLHGSGVRHQTSQAEPHVDDRPLPRTEDMPESELLLLWSHKDRRTPQESGLERQFIGELSEGLSKLSQSNPPWRIRRLTPKEAERLQGFPDGWTEGVSDTQRYKCLGNAVTVAVIKDIFEKISLL